MFHVFYDRRIWLRLSRSERVWQRIRAALSLPDPDGPDESHERQTVPQARQIRGTSAHDSRPATRHSAHGEESRIHEDDRPRGDRQSLIRDPSRYVLGYSLDRPLNTTLLGDNPSTMFDMQTSTDGNNNSNESIDLINPHRISGLQSSPLNNCHEFYNLPPFISSNILLDINNQNILPEAAQNIWKTYLPNSSSMSSGNIYRAFVNQGSVTSGFFPSYFTQFSQAQKSCHRTNRTLATSIWSSTAMEWFWRTRISAYPRSSLASTTRSTCTSTTISPRKIPATSWWTSTRDSPCSISRNTITTESPIRTVPIPPIQVCHRLET